MQLQSVIEDSLSMVQTTMKKSIKIEKEIDSSCGPILGDITQLQQVMVNLCTNASHALGKDGAGTLSVALNPIEIDERMSEEQALEIDPGSYACITISDTGCGMLPEVLERIFEPYFTTKKKGEGTGFGLSIVHGIVRKHRGVISAVSEEGVGTTFTLYFPLLLSDSELQQRDAKRASSADGHGRILFVDDDETVLSMGREILESFGYTVITGTNGRRALETFEKDPAGFDVLVTDYSMPEMNGHELIRHVLKIRPDIPAILCSGYMEKIEGENLKELGHSAFLAKPLDWRELSRTIQDEIRTS